MNIPTTLPEVQDRVSAAEWDARVNLAACYRVVALHGWTDQIFTCKTRRNIGPQKRLLNAVVAD